MQASPESNTKSSRTFLFFFLGKSLITNARAVTFYVKRVYSGFELEWKWNVKRGVWDTHPDNLLQNATNIITKYDNYFVTKCDRSLLQIALDFLLENATLLLQNVTIFTKCDVYYKLRHCKVLCFCFLS